MHADLDFKVLFESAPGLFLVLKPDAAFTILGASDAYLRATLTEREKIVGRGLFEIFPDNPDDPQATGTSNLRASLNRVVSGGTPDAMAVQKYDIRKPDSEGGGFEERFWSPLNSPVFGADGEILYIIHRVEDVTEFIRVSRAGEAQRERSEDLERRNEAMRLEILGRSRDLDEANKNLRLANDRLSELDKAKTVFFSNISHEFRTPLTLLLGPVEDALADKEQALPPAQRSRLELVHHNALRLLKLVNALLDFARIEAGRVDAKYVPTDIARFTAEIASAFHSAVDKAGLTLTVDCPPLAEPAYVDRGMWEKIVLNLVSNAFKFTFKGGIGVGVRDLGERYELRVSDTGVGIPREELPRLFERFHRVPGAKSRTHEGTGIGLSFVRELVKLHGGTITAASGEGKGSTFTVSIPKGREHLPTESVSDPRAAEAAGKSNAVFVEEALRWLPPGKSEIPARSEAKSGARVLLADDNADLRGYVAGLLEPYYRVEAVADGVAALEAARASKPDLVLSDVMMPGLDGFGLLRELRADERTRDVPVILLSARAGEESAVEGLDSGADDYLIKPFAAKELLARVRTHLELTRARHQWARELQQAYRELESFSYSVSHDLRGPLRAIDGFSRILLEEAGQKLGGEERDHLERINAAVARMLDLIDDLLKLSRVTRLPLIREPADLTAMVRAVVDELRRQEPGRRVEAVIQEGLTERVDAGLMRQLWQNLVGNAWKFTRKKDSARIEIGAERRGAGRVFYVRDNGAGFDPRSADKLFQPFQRLHPEREFEGSGIGLAIVQRIVGRHGGRIWAEGRPGRGAAFFFTLDDEGDETIP